MRSMQETKGTYEADLALSYADRTRPQIVRTTTFPQTRPSAWRGFFTRLSRWAGLLLENRYAILSMRILVASVFLLSSIGKLMDITQYSIKPIVEFGILPGSVAIVFGYLLPFVELACALGLLFGVMTRLASLGIAFMSLAFFSVKTFFLLEGYDLECGCFGAVVSTFMSFTVYLDPPLFLMALGVMLAPLPARQWLSAKGVVERRSGEPRTSSRPSQASGRRVQSIHSRGSR